MIYFYLPLFSCNGKVESPYALKHHNILSGLLECEFMSQIHSHVSSNTAFDSEMSVLVEQVAFALLFLTDF